MGFSLVDVAFEAGLGEALNVYGGVHINKYLLEEMGCGAAFFDYDNDGWLDIFLANGSRFDGLPPGSPPSNFLFHNNRDGTFTDVTRKAGLIRSGWGQGCCVGDYDNDGFDDLFVTYWGQNALYHNNGDGTFTDVTEKAGVIQKGARPKWNTGCCFVDYDRDGRLDLFVADYVNFDLDLAPLPGSNKFCMYYGIPVACGPQGWSGGTNILYHNRGDGTFEDVSEAAGVTKPRGPVDPTTVSDNWLPVGSYGMSAVAADFDNDGWPDIYVSCDEAPSLLYHNNHDGTFTEIGVPAMQYSRPDSRLAPKVWAGGRVWLTLTMTGGETYLSRLGTCTPRFRFEDCTSPTRNPRSCSETWVMGISKMSRQKPALGSHWLT